MVGGNDLKYLTRQMVYPLPVREHFRVSRHNKIILNITEKFIFYPKVSALKLIEFFF